jgi:hypothetical protein
MGARWAWLVAVALFVPGAGARADDTAAEIVKKLKDRGAKFDYYITPKGDGPQQFHSHKITDDELELVAKLKTLRIVSLQGNANVTDAGIKRLVGMENLESLDITGTKVTPAGLAHIAKIKKLDSLGCGQESMTDDMLREMIRLNIAYKLSLGNRVGPGRPTSNDEVDWIQLHRAHLTDDGLKLLTVFKNATRIETLRALSVWGTKVTNEGLKELKGLKLHTLKLTPERVDDETLRVLRELNLLHAIAVGPRDNRPGSADDVRWINLDGTKVTDEGLKQLVGLKNLKGVTGSNYTTKKAVDALRNKLPDIDIDP